MASASEVLRLFERHLEVTISKQSKGFASLPDELLALIFKFATHHEQEGTRHASWLSHVSRRFRRIALGDRSLWSTQFLWYDSTKENIERCIHRSGNDSDLHIVVNDNHTIKFSPFNDCMDTCIAFSSRWRSLTLVGDWNESDSDNDLTEMLEIFIRHRHLVLPRLREIRLTQRRYEIATGEPQWYSSSAFVASRPWVTPDLRVMRCTQYIPPPSFPFSTVTHFAFTLSLLPDHAQNQVEELFRFLASREQMTEIDLELNIYHPDFVDLDVEYQLEPSRRFLFTSLA